MSSIKINKLASNNEIVDKINNIYFRDIIEAKITWSGLSHSNFTVDISGTKTNTHKFRIYDNQIYNLFTIDLSKTKVDTTYVIDISNGTIESDEFQVNRPTFNNIDISYNIFKIDEENQIVKQGDPNVYIKWDYSGNIDMYEVELSCNKFTIPTNKRTLPGENFTNYKNQFTYNNIKKTQQIIWDISFNDISGNNNFSFNDHSDFFKVIIKDVDPSNNISNKDLSAVDISSAKFNIIAPEFKVFEVRDEAGNDINDRKIATQGRHVKIIWDYIGNIHDIIIELSNNSIQNNKINITNGLSSSDLSYNWFIPFDNDISGSNYKIILKACKSHYESPECNILNHVNPKESNTFDISNINPIHITYTNTYNQKETIDLTPLSIRKDSSKWFRGIPSIPDLLYFYDTIDISWNETTPLTEGYQVKIDISGLDVNYRKNILFHTVNARDPTADTEFPNGVFKKTFDLSLNEHGGLYFNNNYMIVVSKDDKENFFSQPFKINRPVFNNINYKIQKKPNSRVETFDISGQEISQGDRITINWDYSGNIKDVDLELYSHNYTIPVNNILDDNKNVSIDNVVKTASFIWDVSYNEISGNSFYTEFPENKYFKIILKDKDPSNNITAVDLSSSKFNIIAPRLGKITLIDETGTDVKKSRKIKQGKNSKIEWDYSGNINNIQLELSNNIMNICPYKIVGINNSTNTFTLDNVDDLNIGDELTFKSTSTLQFENLKHDGKYIISTVNSINKTINLSVFLDVSYNVMDISFNQDSLTLNTVENLSVNDKIKLFFDSPTFTAGNQSMTLTEKEYEIAEMYQNKIRLKEIGGMNTKWIDISTNDLSAFVSRKDEPNMGDFNIYITKDFTNDFPENNFTLEKACGKLYRLKNLSILSSVINDGNFTYTVPINDGIKGENFSIVIKPITGGYQNLSLVDKIDNSILDYVFDISHNRFLKIEVFGDKTNAPVSFEYKIYTISGKDITLEGIYGLNIGDELVFNNQKNSFISSDTVNNLEPLKTYKIKTIIGKKITIVPGDIVNVDDVNAITITTNEIYNSMFEKKINGNKFLLFFKRNNILKFNISREALDVGYNFLLVGPLSRQEPPENSLTNLNSCSSVKVNLYVFEIQINMIFEEKKNSKQKFDIENNEDYYLLLRSNDNNKYYDISSNIFKIKYFDDCEKFPFGRFNNSKTNLKLYPFLDSGNTIQGRNPIFNSSIQVKKSSRMSYISRNRYIDR